MTRTGVVIGVLAETSAATAATILDHLRDRYPGVEFSVVGGACSVAFEFDDEAVTP